MYSIKKVKCKNAPCEKMIAQFNSLQKYCGKGCEIADKKSRGTYTPTKANKVGKTAIKKISNRRAEQMKEYSKLRREFLKENLRCAVFPYLRATEVHHKKGRTGGLLTDTRYFLAVSRVGHQQIENCPQWAREKGYIETRIKD